MSYELIKSSKYKGWKIEIYQSGYNVFHYSCYNPEGVEIKSKGSSGSWKSEKYALEMAQKYIEENY